MTPIRCAFDGGRITSDGGVMLLAAAERRLQLADTLAAAIHDPRDPQRVTHVLIKLNAKILPECRLDGSADCGILARLAALAHF